MGAPMDGFLITAGVLVVVAGVFCAAMVLVTAALGAVAWAVKSVVMLVPKFYRSYQDGQASTLWPLMLFYLVAPTSIVLLGFGLSQYVQAAQFTPTIVEALQPHLANGWVFSLVAFGGVILLAMNLASIGTYVASFGWPHRAYREQSFNKGTLSLLAMLFVVAFLAVPTLAWVGVYSL